MDFTFTTLLLFFFGALLVGLVFLVLCFMLYLHYVHTRNAHLPGPPRTSFIFGNVLEIWRYQKETGKTVPEYLMEKRSEYGPIFLITYVHRCIVILGDPSYVREVFVNHNKYLHKSPFLYNKLGFIFGERGMGFGLVSNVDEILWSERRRILNPAFHRRCLKEFVANFNSVSSRFLIHMENIADAGRPVSMVAEFGKATLESISQVSFHINTNSIEDPESPFPSAIANYLRGVQANIESPLLSLLLGTFQYDIFLNGSQRVQINAARFLRKFASDCITNRMKDISEKKDVPNDLLYLLISDGSLTMEEIVDEFITIFVSGQETTASFLAITLYEIICHPHVEEKILDELEEVLGEEEDVKYEDLAKLRYLGQVFEESLRVHPIAPAPNRILQKEITVGGYRIPKGNGVASNSQLFSMDPEFWKDPDKFYPERFAEAGNIPNFNMIHFPFSVGSRNCIGQTFAKFESKVVLAKLLRKFQFQLCPGQTSQLIGRMTLTPRDGVMCEVIRRSRR